jgi:hypothetical protein
MDNLLNYPTTTLVNRLLPKKVFYEKLDMGTKMKQHFVDDLAQLTWLYKLAATTVNTNKGKTIEEIDIFVATLKSKDCPDDVFKFIDSSMPRYIVFIQQYEDAFRLLLNYKDPTGDTVHPFKITKSFHTAWINAPQSLQLPIVGKTLDEVWEHFAGTISGYNTSTADDTKTIIRLEEQLAAKRKAAEALQKKVRREKQFNKQLEMNTRARQMKREIASLEEKIMGLKQKK